MKSHISAQGQKNIGPVFIIGHGRSGTHWLAHSLSEHPMIRVTIESRPIFSLSNRIAIDPSLEKALFPRLVEEYKKEIAISVPKLYIDKSHNNIWLVDQLLYAFPDCLFIGIERNPYATIASMMLHPGFLAYKEKWKTMPIPNRFLGITKELMSTYDGLSFVTQSAMRWKAFHEQMQYIKKSFMHKVLMVGYEDFIYNTKQVLSSLDSFLMLEPSLSHPRVNSDSLCKWKTQLTDDEIMEIQEIVGYPPSHIM